MYIYKSNITRKRERVPRTNKSSNDNAYRERGNAYTRSNLEDRKRRGAVTVARWARWRVCEADALLEFPIKSRSTYTQSWSNCENHQTTPYPRPWTTPRHPDTGSIMIIKYYSDQIRGWVHCNQSFLLLPFFYIYNFLNKRRTIRKAGRACLLANNKKDTPSLDAHRRNWILLLSVQTQFCFIYF